MTVVHAVQDHTHALPGSDQGGDANEESDQRHDTPSAAGAANSEDDGSEQSSHDTTDTKTTSEDDARAVSIADGPADEVGVGLAAQRPLDRRHDILERRWVGRVLQSVEQRGAFLGG